MAVLLYFTEKHLIFVQKQCLTKNEESCNMTGFVMIPSATAFFMQQGCPAANG